MGSIHRRKVGLIFLIHQKLHRQFLGQETVHPPHVPYARSQGVTKTLWLRLVEFWRNAKSVPVWLVIFCVVFSEVALKLEKRKKTKGREEEGAPEAFRK